MKLETLERREKLPVVMEVDVLVAGGGPAGVAAAIAAARAGLRTLVVEQFNCLGGVATAGGHGHICLYTAWQDPNQRVVGGIPFEVGERVVKAGYGRYFQGGYDFEVEGMKLVLEQMAEECGLQLLYHTMVADAVTDNDSVVGVVVQNKNGRQVIKARQFVDCTGDGDLAARSGCTFQMGDEESGLCQPVTLMFTIGGVDMEKVEEYRRQYKADHPEEARPWHFESVWREAQQKGDMRPFQSRIMGWWWTPTRPDQIGVNFTHMTNIDSTKAEDLTKATIEGRKQAYESIEVYRKYIPGMENCYMISTPNTVGIRESRRIQTKYILTKEDIIAENTFADSIGYGSFFIDIHNCSGIGMDDKTFYPRKGFKYQIPYRILRPGNFDNLQVAGRCAGTTHEALGSLRVMPQCGVAGQAAGTAAALALRQQVALDELDIAELQCELRRQGAIITEDDIA